MTTSNCKRSDNIYVRQWDVGSFTDPSKKPYKISERYNGTWECSCPAWTRHTPRTNCKHITKVQNALRTMPASAVFVPAQPKDLPASITFDGYTIRRRALEDALTNANDTATTRRSPRNI